MHPPTDVLCLCQIRWICSLDQPFLELIDVFIQPFEDAEKQIDKLVEHQVAEKGRVVPNQGRVLDDPLAQFVEAWRRLVVNCDQVAPA